MALFGPKVRELKAHCSRCGGDVKVTMDPRLCGKEAMDYLDQALETEFRCPHCGAQGKAAKILVRKELEAQIPPCK